MKRAIYLIQRLNAPAEPTPFDFGGGLLNGGINKEAMNILKKIWSFDYMGSAEFEWGAVPTALETLANSSLTSSTITVGDKIIYVIAPSGIETEVVNWIFEASKERYHHGLKEHLGLKEALDEDKYTRTKGWLRIESDKNCFEPFMFFIDKEMFEKTWQLFTSNKS